MTRWQLWVKTHLHVPRMSSRVPDGVGSPCEIVITAKTGTNGKVLRVRCKCMAQVNLPPNGRYYQYDWLAEGEMSLDEAVRIWKEHRDATPES